MTAVSPYLKLPLRNEAEILQAREQHRRAIAEAMAESSLDWDPGLEQAANLIDRLIAPAVTVTEEMVERAHRTYERYGQQGDLQTMRISDAMMRAVLEAALKSTTPQTGSQE